MEKIRGKKEQRELSIVIPTYNEVENIESLILSIERVFEDNSINGEIIVVDDNSPDGTADVVKKYTERFDNIRILERKEKKGLGYSYKDGFQAISGSVVMEMDADFSHNPLDICRILRKCGDGFDVVIGSRYVKGGGIIGWGFIRRVFSFVANTLVDMLFRLGVKDNTSGFRAYKREALEAILPNVKCNSYDFQVEMLIRAKEQGLTLKEVPIIFRERVRGKSKLGKGECSSFIKMLLRETMLKNRNFF
ncbi:MAG: polyprenol monophosphomannose synthase [Candidatus Jordarchaeum sp.]|uniref:polyprenol monophosphomannose synthase n=1 Tax=Candidatus Jordarchaeum sp. TaxID=2823881 RepID=UPI00404952E2